MQGKGVRHCSGEKIVADVHEFSILRHEMSRTLKLLATRLQGSGHGSCVSAFGGKRFPHTPRPDDDFSRQVVKTTALSVIDNNNTAYQGKTKSIVGISDTPNTTTGTSYVHRFIDSTQNRDSRTPLP